MTIEFVAEKAKKTYRLILVFWNSATCPFDLSVISWCFCFISSWHHWSLPIKGNLYIQKCYTLPTGGIRICLCFSM